MKTVKHKLAIIVPTKDHPEDLRKLLLSLRASSRRPDQLIIVDGGDQPVEQLIRSFPDLAVDYVRCRPPGLTKQRNLGFQALREGMTLVGYLDDDIVLSKEALANILSFWETASARTGGTSFNITNNPRGRYTIFDYLFLIYQGRQGVVLKSGQSIILSPVLSDTRVQWLCGGATVWARQVLEKYRFDEWFKGCAYVEDLDFSFRVGKEYDLYVVKNAEVQHFPAGIPKEKQSIFARELVVGKYHFISKHTDYFSKPLFFWSLFGQMLKSLLAGIIRPWSEHPAKFKGKFLGLAAIASNRAESVAAQKEIEC